MAPYADEEARGATLTARAPVDRIIILNCYGRGGSGIAWRMIGSSPDVIMTSEEWHVGVFGTRKTLRKGLLLTFRSLGIRTFEPLRRYAFRKTLEMQRPNDVTTKTDARSLVVKLMDYHIVFAQMIGTSFERATFVNLTRHPYGLCESLMRSGLSLLEACRWYDDVARMMAQQAESGRSLCGSRTLSPGRWRPATGSIDPSACAGPKTASSSSRSSRMGQIV